MECIFQSKYNNTWKDNNMIPTIIITNGSATNFVAQSVSTVIPVDSKTTTISVMNKSDIPLDFHYRMTGGIEIAPINILEGRISGNIIISLNTLQSFDYYVSNGLVDIYIIDYSLGVAPPPESIFYCTAAQVASFMGLPTFTGITSPTLTEVNDIILSVCDEIDQFTHHAWRTTTVTNEYYTAMSWTPMTDGLGDWSDRSRIYMMHRKIHYPMLKLECFDGNTWVDFIANYIEGRGQDYWLDYDRGIIIFANRYPLRRRNAVRLTYQFGDTIVPADIKNVAVMLCCYQLLQRDDRSVLLPEGTSNISPQSKAELWYNRAYKILARHVDLISYQ